MMNRSNVLLLVGVLVAGALLGAQSAAPAKGDSDAPRYDVTTVLMDGEALLGVIDHRSDTLHIYRKRENRTLEHEGVLDLSKVGDRWIEYGFPAQP